MGGGGEYPSANHGGGGENIRNYLQTSYVSPNQIFYVNVWRYYTLILRYITGELCHFQYLPDVTPVHLVNILFIPTLFYMGSSVFYATSIYSRHQFMQTDFVYAGRHFYMPKLIFLYLPTESFFMTADLFLYAGAAKSFLYAS